MNLACLGDLLEHYNDQAGVNATVTFKRLDQITSSPANSLYRERLPSQQVFTEWVLKAVVDENPKTNIKGGLGAQTKAEIQFFVYNLETAEDEPRTYVPEEEDFVLYRDIRYEVTEVERILPSGDATQMGFRLEGQRYR